MTSTLSANSSLKFTLGPKLKATEPSISSCKTRRNLLQGVTKKSKSSFWKRKKTDNTIQLLSQMNSASPFLSRRRKKNQCQNKMSSLASTNHGNLLSHPLTLSLKNQRTEVLQQSKLRCIEVHLSQWF